MTDQNPFTAPANSDLIKLNKTDDFYDEKPKRRVRFYAAMIDGILATIVAWSYILIIMGKKLNKNITFSYTELLTLSIIGISLFFILHGYLLYKNGQTVGKFLLKIKIVSLDGTKPEFFKLILLRYAPLWVVGYIPVIGRYIPSIDILAIFTKDKRCIHDYIAATKVVKI